MQPSPVTNPLEEQAAVAQEGGAVQLPGQLGLPLRSAAGLQQLRESYGGCVGGVPQNKSAAGPGGIIGERTASNIGRRSRSSRAQSAGPQSQGEDSAQPSPPAGAGVGAGAADRAPSCAARPRSLRPLLAILLPCAAAKRPPAAPVARAGRRRVLPRYRRWPQLARAARTLSTAAAGGQAAHW